MRLDDVINDVKIGCMPALARILKKCAKFGAFFEFVKRENLADTLFGFIKKN